MCPHTLPAARPSALVGFGPDPGPRPCGQLGTEPACFAANAILFGMNQTETAATLPPAVSTRPRVFSGMQPTGNLHLGNYLGALKQWVEKQDERDNIFCVVDLHALTLPESIEPARLKENSRRVVALYMAAGIDPDKSLLFVQSHLHEHSELTWILNCTTPLGWLQRMTQYKDKRQKGESVGTGLLDYPVLMAADILLYDTELVPVGEDQVQHVELTRDIAVRFNNLFGDVFVIPKATIPELGARVMGFDDPRVKMSKSLAAERGGHAVHLLDDEKSIRKTVMSAVTDSGRETRFEHASPGVRNLLSLYQTLRAVSRDEAEETFAGKGYGDLKKAVLEAILDTLQPIRRRFDEIVADPERLEAVLERGAERARKLARPTLERVKSAVGVG
jgi:tryptophanyl-tRNA synthetase